MSALPPYRNKEDIGLLGDLPEVHTDKYEIHGLQEDGQARPGAGLHP